MTPNVRKPKICLLTETYYPVVGGGETQTKVLAEVLVDNGFAVIVVTRRSSRSLAKAENIGSVPVYRTPPVGAGHLRRWGMLLAAFPTLLSRSGQYDIIYVSGFKALGITAVLVSKLLGKRCILKADSNGEMSGDFFAGGLNKVGLTPSSYLVRPLRALRNTILRQADCFIAISSDIAAELAQYGVRAENIHLIANSVDTMRFCPLNPADKRALRHQLGIPGEDTVLVFTGRLVSYKGLPLLLKVWKEIREQHTRVRLLLVGSGGLDMHNCEAELKAYVHSKGLTDSVQFTGDVYNVHEYLQASDVFVFPTEKEAFGISLIEAMACGLPVITTATGGIKDFINHGGNGIVVDAKDFQQLYTALDVLIGNKVLAATLGAAALETAQERFAQNMVTRQYIALFTQPYLHAQ